MFKNPLALFPCCFWFSQSVLNTQPVIIELEGTFISSCLRWNRLFRVECQIQLRTKHKQQTVILKMHLGH